MNKFHIEKLPICKNINNNVYFYCGFYEVYNQTYRNRTLRLRKTDQFKADGAMIDNIVKHGQ